LSLEELEAVRLVDLLELEQEEAAFYMGVSRKAFWNDLASARKKIAMALIYGTGILIQGGSYILREAEETLTSIERGREGCSRSGDCSGWRGSCIFLEPGWITSAPGWLL